ncbi:MAG: hypothetical protein WC651_01880 [Candidatus Gracilibacteria bacterium]|jgi:hypothetical protein
MNNLQERFEGSDQRVDGANRGGGDKGSESVQDRRAFLKRLASIGLVGAVATIPGCDYIIDQIPVLKGEEEALRAAEALRAREALCPSEAPLPPNETHYGPEAMEEALKTIPERPPLFLQDLILSPDGRLKEDFVQIMIKFFAEEMNIPESEICVEEGEELDPEIVFTTCKFVKLTLDGNVLFSAYTPLNIDGLRFFHLSLPSHKETFSYRSYPESDGQKGGADTTQGCGGDDYSFEREEVVASPDSPDLSRYFREIYSAIGNDGGWLVFGEKDGNTERVLRVSYTRPLSALGGGTQGNPTPQIYYPSAEAKEIYDAYKQTLRDWDNSREP